MSFLKSLGTVLKDAARIGTPLVPGVGPLLAPVVNQLLPAGTTKLDQIGEIAATIIQVEAAGQAAGKTGFQMAADAGPLVETLLMKSPIFANRKIKDQALLDKGFKEVGGGFADIMNAFEIETVVTKP